MAKELVYDDKGDFAEAEADLLLSLTEENKALRQRIAVLELQLSSSRAATRAAHSALLEQDMGACLEDGTPVLSLVLEDKPDLQAGLMRTYLA